MRSGWKVPFTTSSLLKLKKDSINNIKIWSRSSCILSKFINKTVFIHCGNSFSKIIVTPGMVGNKFGQYAFTRKMSKSRKKIKKKKK